MGAPDILSILQAAGLRLTADGDRLLVTPASAIIDEVRNLIRARKPDLLRLLAAGDTALASPDREAFEERAAIREYDGGYSRDDAELPLGR
jgi:hypothetical protein